jgi:DNA replication and repair protein RecF
MRIHHLSLVNFRNYTRLELGFSTPLTLIQGDNAQGKTNLLEAVYVLATSRSPRGASEREMVNWLALAEPIPYARLAADVERGGRRQRLEIVLAPQNGREGSGPTLRKQVKINGVAKRAMDLVGLLPVVLFAPEDVELASGAPAIRRRYLDVALCQVDGAYCRALTEYNRVLMQRNALLRHLREQGGSPEQLRFWDERLVKYGSVLLARRRDFIAALEKEAQPRLQALTEGRERLRFHYLAGIDLLRQTPAPPPSGREDAATAALTADEIANLFGEQLRAARPREIAAGACLYGPHRDDLRTLINGRDLRLYGSRAQQRTVALTMKLAEMAVMGQTLGEPPLLLLDDIMSELDAKRRAALAAVLDGVPQAICTTTDWSDFTEALRARARCLRVVEGRIEEVEGSLA